MIDAKLTKDQSELVTKLAKISEERNCTRWLLYGNELICSCDRQGERVPGVPGDPDFYEALADEGFIHVTRLRDSYQMGVRFEEAAIVVLQKALDYGCAQLGSGTLLLPLPGADKYTVFVSSTYNDLVEYREAVREALKQIGLLPEHIRGMEEFGARPQPPLDVCLGEVRASDIYLGILGMRYGSIPKDSDHSVTHLELREAEKAKLQMLIYVADELKYKFLAKDMDQGEKAEKLKRLKEYVSDHHTLGWFCDPRTLREGIMRDVPRLLQMMEEFSVEDIIEEFGSIKHLFEQKDIEASAPELMKELRSYGIRTRQGLNQLVTDETVLNVLGRLYVDELGRQSSTPLDPHAVATRGAQLFISGTGPDQIERMRKTMRDSDEYKERQASQ